MAQPDRNSNPDPDRPSGSIEQEIHLDRNEGRLNASSSGDRSNVIQGDGSQITQIQQQTIYVTHPSSEVKRERLPRFWSDRRFALFFWGCAIVGVLGTVEAVFHPLKVYQQRMAFQSCAKVAREENKPLVIIATFEDKSKQLRPNLWLEEMIKDDLGGLNDFVEARSCLLNTKVANAEIAHKIGKTEKAQIVIWGIISNSSIKIRLTPINFSISKFKEVSIYADTNKELEVKVEEIPPLITVMTAYAVGVNFRRENENNKDKAIEILDKALKFSENYLNLKNFSRDYLSEAYFHLGGWLLFDERGCFTNTDKCKQSINYHLKAIELDNDNHFARLRLGGIYTALEKYEDAKKIYESIFESNLDPEYAAGACQNIQQFPDEIEYRTIKLQCEQLNYSL